jgi:hypothetical protein
MAVSLVTSNNTSTRSQVPDSPWGASRPHPFRSCTYKLAGHISYVARTMADRRPDDVLLQKLGQWYVFGKEQLIRGHTSDLISAKIHVFNQSSQAAESHLWCHRGETAWTKRHDRRRLWGKVHGGTSTRFGKLCTRTCCSTMR